jgi:hypothetical protein
MVKKNTEIKIGRCDDCPMYRSSPGGVADRCMFPWKVKHITTKEDMFTQCPLRSENLTIKFLPKNQRRKKKVYPE